MFYNIIYNEENTSAGFHKAKLELGMPKCRGTFMTSKEFEIKTLGHIIRGQSWGDPNNPTILAIHGWLDNSNSFEWLAEHFQENYHFMAIDLPGHGHSTHLPKCAHYHFIDGIFLLKQIVHCI